MQTILGASGQIAVELSRELARNYTTQLRLVSRNPKKVNDTDHLFPANLLDAEQTLAAVQGSEVVYFTAGLPPDTEMWEAQFPTMLKNALDASRAAGAKFVYFDNTYMYPQDNRLLKEDSLFQPNGRKGKVRADMATMVLQEMAKGVIPVLIGRAPEFYGPGKTQSFTNALVIDRLNRGEKPRIPISDKHRRTLIWTPDASKALALLGNTAKAYNQTWHLPCDDNRLTYKQFITLATRIYGQSGDYSVVSRLTMSVAGLFKKEVREIAELLPRYQHHNLFDSSKFKHHFPHFSVTTYEEGLLEIWKQHNINIRQ